MYHYEVISNEYLFEEFIKDLFNEFNETSSFQLYKNKGATQHGIDVFSTEKKIIIQCKKKDPSKPDSKLRNELMADFDESLVKIQDLPFDFDIFILASTTKKYSVIQDYAAKLAKEHDFDILFLSWKDIERQIHKCPKTRSVYFPHLTKEVIKSAPNLNNINKSHIYGNVTQIGGDLKISTTKAPNINILPPRGTIGANPMLKQSIEIGFNKIGEEREKRFGKKAYQVLYNNFKKDFGIKNAKWTIIWGWPEACAEEILQYLDTKYKNTIAGRMENAASKPTYIHERPYLYKREKELLGQIGLSMNCQIVKDFLSRFFRVDTHAKLTHLEHWQLVCYLEQEVKDSYEENG
jgi:hypothetical protein